MKKDNERRQKQLDETTFTSKSDIKFTKAPPPNGTRKLVKPSTTTTTTVSDKK